MCKAAFLALALGTGLAGCGAVPGSEQNASMLEVEAEHANAFAAMDSWERVFDAPELTIGNVNQFGYRATPYGPVEGGAGFASQGADIPISDTAAAKPNSTTFSATGATAASIETLTFALAITDPDDAETAKTRFRDIVSGFFSQYDIDLSEEIGAGVTEEATATTEAPGATLKFAKEAMAGGEPDNRRLTVTITRTGGTAPATQEPEAQGTDDGNRS